MNSISLPKILGAAFLYAATAIAFANPAYDSETSVKTGSTRYIALADSADVCIAKEEWARAENYLLKALRLEPGNFHNSLLLSNLGSVQLEQNRPEEALQSFNIGLSIAPKSSTLLVNRAQANIYLGNNSDAVSDLTEALANDSTLRRPLRLRSYLYLSEGETESARKDLQKLLAISTERADSVFAYNGLAECCISENHTEEALRLYSKSLEIEPDAETYFARGFARIRSGDNAGALEDVNEGLYLSPDSGDLLVLRAYLRRARYQIPESEADLKIAIANGADPQLIRMFFPEKQKK